MLTGPLVGLNKVLVTIAPGFSTVNDTVALFVVGPVPTPALLVTGPAATVVNEMLIFVLCPGVSVPMFVHTSELAVLVAVGVRLADWKVSLPDGKLSDNDDICQRRAAGVQDLEVELDGGADERETIGGRDDGFINPAMPGTPGGGIIVAVVVTVPTELL